MTDTRPADAIAYPFPGRRVAEIPNGDYSVLKPGEYGKYRSTWFARTPNGLACDLTQHDLTEHADGSLTCSPSVEVKAGDAGYWHGFLKNGVWSLT